MGQRLIEIVSVAGLLDENTQKKTKEQQPLRNI